MGLDSVSFVWWPLILLLPLPLLIRLLPAARKQPGEALMMPSLDGFTQPGQSHTSNRLFPILSAIWVLTVLALMRPQWTGEPVNLPSSGRDLLLAVDISGSMNQENMLLEGRRTSKLTIVKQVVSDFIDNRAGDRVGLIVFGTQAYLRAPLTFDRKTVNRLLQEIPPVSLAGRKTAIGDAIGLATRQLIRKKSGDRILILLTDGANTSGEISPAKAAQLARQENIRIYTIGVGGSPANLFESLFGAHALGGSDLDADTLKDIAKTTGGQYFHANSTQELVNIYERLNDHEPVIQPDQPYRPTRTLVHYPLGLAFLLSLALALYLLRTTFTRLIT